MEQENGNLRQCRRCLLRDMADEEGHFRAIWEYIEQLDVDVKAAEALFEDRLTVCKACDLLLAGICRSCGCYVEMRAAVAKNRCPREKW